MARMAGNITATGVWRWMSKTDAGGWEQRAQLITTNSFLVIELERSLSWIKDLTGLVQELLDDCASCWLGTAGDTTYYNQAGHTPGIRFFMYMYLRVLRLQDLYTKIAFAAIFYRCSI